MLFQARSVPHARSQHSPPAVRLSLGSGQNNHRPRGAHNTIEPNAHSDSPAAAGRHPCGAASYEPVSVGSSRAPGDRLCSATLRTFSSVCRASAFADSRSSGRLDVVRRVGPPPSSSWRAVGSSRVPLVRREREVRAHGGVYGSVSIGRFAGPRRGNKHFCCARPCGARAIFPWLPSWRTQPLSFPVPPGPGRRSRWATSPQRPSR
jgi:hypothetical protein